MTTATDHAHRLFTESVLADDGGGYPNQVSFIARDIPDWESIAWRSLVHEQQPTVIVDEDALEIMLVPIHRPALLARIDRIRGRVPVRVGWRHHNGAPTYAVPVSLSRSRLAALEQAAPVPA
jgi:hypothetical protein